MWTFLFKISIRLIFSFLIIFSAQGETSVSSLPGGDGSLAPQTPSPLITTEPAGSSLPGGDGSLAPQTPSPFITTEPAGSSLPGSDGSLAPQTPSPFVKGVVLIVHGLNYRGDKMDDVANIFMKAGVLPLLVSLKGHNQDPKNWEEVTGDDWLKEVYDSIAYSKAVAYKHNVPLYYAGYSMGGLLFYKIIQVHPKIVENFKHVFLFAPALSLRWYAPLIKVFNIFGESFTLPSKTPEDLRANPKTTMRAYNAFFDIYDNWSEKFHSLPDMPTDIFIDPDDELVSAQGIYDLVAKLGITYWHIHEVKVKEGGYHHLVVDRKNIEEKSWDMIERNIQSAIP